MHCTADYVVSADVVVQAERCLPAPAKSFGADWKDIHLRAVDDVRSCMTQIPRSVLTRLANVTGMNQVLGRVFPAPVLPRIITSNSVRPRHYLCPLVVFGLPP